MRYAQLLRKPRDAGQAAALLDLYFAIVSESVNLPYTFCYAKPRGVPATKQA
jgi:hypothetical protein